MQEYVFLFAKDLMEYTLSIIAIFSLAILVAGGSSKLVYAIIGVLSIAGAIFAATAALCAPINSATIWQGYAVALLAFVLIALLVFWRRSVLIKRDGQGIQPKQAN